VVFTPPYDEAEKQIIAAFYPLYFAPFIARAISRSPWGVRAFASKNSIRGDRHGRHPTEEDERRFWLHLRAYLRVRLPEWFNNGLRERAMRLVWAPPRVEAENCDECELVATCDGYPLPCMTVTVRDWLRQGGRLG